MIQCVLILLTLLCLPMSAANAQPADPIVARLERAKRDFAERIDSFDKSVIKKLREAGEKAAKAGHKDTVGRIDREIAAFQDEGLMPLSIPVGDLIARREALRRPLRAAYQKAIEEYARASMKGQAESLQTELKALNNTFARSGIGPSSWENRLVRITNALTGGVLDVSPVPGKETEVVQAKLDAGRNQLWTVRKRSDVGPYQIVNVQHDLLLNVPYNEKREGLGLIIYRDQHGHANELWTFRLSGRSFQIISSNGLAVAVAGPGEGAAVVQVKPRGALSEYWRIEIVGED